LVEQLSNSAHVHLLLNHVPTVGFGLGLGMFLVSLAARNKELEKTSLGVFFLVAVATIGTYTSGNGAESILRGIAEAPAFPPGVSPAAIRAHEDAALSATALMEATGFFAWLGIWQWRRISKLPGWNTALILVLSLMSFAAMARTAEMGGQIRHTEIHAEDTPLALLTLDAVGRCTIDLAAGANYRFDPGPEGQTGASDKTAASTKTVVEGTAGDIITSGECVYLSDGAGGREADQWYQATSNRSYASARPIGLAQDDIKKGEKGAIRVLGRLTSDHAPSTETDEAGGSLSTSGLGLARDLGLFVSGRTWVWPTCETLHFIGLCLLFTVVVILDLRILGMAKMLSLEAVYQLLPIGMLGFGVNLITGMLFFIGVPGQYVHNVTFFWKIFFVLLGGLNVTYFMFVDDVWTIKAGEEAGTTPKFAALSAIVIWVMVLYCGHMLPFIGNAF
jgi:hypothetical protein